MLLTDFCPRSHNQASKLSKMPQELHSDRLSHILNEDMKEQCWRFRLKVVFQTSAFSHVVEKLSKHSVLKDLHQISKEMLTY